MLDLIRTLARRIFFSLGLLLCSHWGQADLIAPSPEDMAVIMAAEMGTSVNTLSRDVITYHWQPRSVVGLPETGIVDPIHPTGLAYFKGVTGFFWANAASSGLMMGNGIYVATDPIVSQSYGGGPEKWALFAVKLRAGTRLFDARESPSFSGELRDRLALLGCPPWNNPADIFANSTVPNPTCADIFHQALRILGSQGTVYGWGGFSLAACSIRNSWSIPAIVLYDPTLAQDVRILVKEIPPNEPDEIHDLRIRVTHYFHLVEGSGYSYGGSEPWPSLSASERPADLIEWVQSHTYFCDAANWEDLLPSQLIFSSSELVEKHEEIQEKAELVSAKIGRVIRPERFRAVLALQYYTPAQMQNVPAATWMAAPEFRAWLRVQTLQIEAAAKGWTPLSAQSVLKWVQAWGVAGAESPALIPERSHALSVLLAELNAALFNPRQASTRDKPLLSDVEALIRAYHLRMLQLAPLTAQNDRLARALIGYIAIVRDWPPILIRFALDEVSSVDSLKAVVMMDKCLDRYSSGTVTPNSDCEMLEVDGLISGLRD